MSLTDTDRKWREKNKEYLSSYHREWQRKNKEYINAYQRERRRKQKVEKLLEGDKNEQRAT